MSKTDLSDFIKSSSLTVEDKVVWEDILTFCDDEVCTVLASYINQDRAKLEFLTQNIKLKRQAFTEDRPELFAEILRREKQAIEET